MKDNENATYYLLRAEQEEEAAREATNPLAAKIHLSLADRYRSKANGHGDVLAAQEVSVVRD